MKVFVTQKLPGDYVDSLKKKFKVEVWTKKDISRKELLRKVKGVDGILCLLTEKIDAEVMDAAGDQLKVISNYAVGFDNIDVLEATRRGIVVTNTPGVLTESVAEHVFALAIAIARRVVEGDRFVREGKFDGWEPDTLVGSTLIGKTLGIVGLGRIGKWTVRLAKGFGMKVIYHSRTRDEEFELEYGVEYKNNLERLLKVADVVSLNVPLTKETDGMIGMKQFKQMKRGAILINTARGAVVKENDLIRALKKKLIVGAGIDVYENENKINSELLRLDNLVMTPHIASATTESREMMADLATEGLDQVLSGNKPESIVNDEVWEKRRCN